MDRLLPPREYLNKVARQHNERPRETLQFKTPAEKFNALRRPVEPGTQKADIAAGTMAVSLRAKASAS